MPMVPAEFESERGSVRARFIVPRRIPRGAPRRVPEEVGIRTSRSIVPRTSGDPSRINLGSPDMKIKNSLKSLRTRHRDNRLVRRKGRVYIINKTNPRFKARQG